MEFGAMTNDGSFSDDGRSGIKAILVPTDFSESADVALKLAIDLALQQNARIHLLHVLRSRDVSRETDMMKKQIARFPEASTIEIIPETGKGKIHEEILNMQAKKEIDLIVMGRRKKAYSLYSLFRSTTAEVRKKARCSVLLVGA